MDIPVERAVETAVFDIMNIRFTISTDTPELLQEIERRFGTGLQPGQPKRNVEVEAYRRSNGFQVQFEGREQVLRLSHRWPLFNDLIQMIVQRENPAHAFIHGSCVVGLEGAVILFGRSTAGKTTLALALANQGYKLLSEDTTPLDISRGTVHPFQTRPNLRTHTAKIAGEGAWQLEFATGVAMPEAPLKLIIHLVPRTHSRTGIVGTIEIDEWHKLLDLCGASGIYCASKCTEVPVCDHGDFDCPPEIRELRPFEMLRELLGHTHFSPSLSLPARMKGMAAVLERAHLYRLTPGYLDDSVRLIARLLKDSNFQ